MPSTISHVKTTSRDMRHKMMVACRKAKINGDIEGVKRYLRTAYHFHGMVMASVWMESQGYSNYFSHELTKDIMNYYKDMIDNIIWFKYDRAKAVRH